MFIQSINGIEILKGKTKFDYELAQLKNAKGILPERIIFDSSNKNLLSKDPAHWNEFFAYDEHNSLIILSPAPLYFIKIQSQSFFHHLDKEFKQIVGGINGQDKKISSSALLKKVGDFEVGLYFTPKELSYNTSFRIIQIGSERSKRDIWRLLEASGEAIIYLPIFEETQLFHDLQIDVAYGKSRMVYTKNSMIPTLGPTHIIEHPIDFSFMMGKNLQKTNCLLDKQALFLTENYTVTRDFIVFFSLPLGNSRQCGRFSRCIPRGGRRKDFLETDNGIAILYRGDLSRFENFFLKDNFDLNHSKAHLNIGEIKKIERCKAPRT